MNKWLFAAVGFALGAVLGAGASEWINADSIAAVAHATAEAEDVRGKLAAKQREVDELAAEKGDLLQEAAAAARQHASKAEQRPESAAAALEENRRLQDKAVDAHANANIIGGEFRYDNFDWRVGDDDMLRFQGEITNLGDTAWTVSFFQFDAYSPDGSLVSTIPVMINNLPAHESKAFDAYSGDEVGTQSKLTFKVHFNGGEEDN